MLQQDFIFGVKCCLGVVKPGQRLVGLVGRLITPQQMMDILPADPWIRLNIAESFEKAQKQDVASLILKSVEIEPLFEEQSNRLAN